MQALFVRQRLGAAGLRGGRSSSVREARCVTGPASCPHYWVGKYANFLASRRLPGCRWSSAPSRRSRPPNSSSPHR
eukprot:1160950-Pelagomonas_calceolata.AAC.5